MDLDLGRIRTRTKTLLTADRGLRGQHQRLTTQSNNLGCQLGRSRLLRHALIVTRQLVEHQQQQSLLDRSLRITMGPRDFTQALVNVVVLDALDSTLLFIGL